MSSPTNEAELPVALFLCAQGTWRPAANEGLRRLPSLWWPPAGGLGRLREALWCSCHVCCCRHRHSAARGSVWLAWWEQGCRRPFSGCRCWWQNACGRAQDPLPQGPYGVPVGRASDCQSSVPTPRTRSCTKTERHNEEALD
ncbi:hypothetical protein HJG60_010811 [Phyllostomus discolor]|uniref:Uncharacterized protein n=1 Tax=Phyllostomus discolor TaxID=89673 RepID=A0A834ADI1_9CHIR|nr:hypothetical protein HJG60_010811 [Phyllostomus discolor]